MKPNNLPRFTQPVIRKGDGKPGSWYIEFYFQHPDTGNMVRHRIKSATRFGGKKITALITSAKARQSYFSQLLVEVSGQLAAGWSPYINTPAPEPVQLPSPIVQVLQHIEKELQNIRPRTRANYLQAASKFIQYLQSHYPGIREIQDITHEAATGFLATQCQRPASQNSFIRSLKAVFSSIAKSHNMKHNPFQKVALLREIPTANTPYTIAEARNIMQVAAARHPALFLAIAFEYYAFMRPNEIRMLQRKHIDLETMTLTIPGRIRKRGRTTTIPIHYDLGILLGGRVQGLDWEDWIFDNGQGMPVNRFYFATAWSRIKKELDIRTGQTLYSFKHTGAINLYQATKDVYLVSRMCGHQDISTTEIYLRGLGQTVGEFNIQTLKSIT